MIGTTVILWLMGLCLGALAVLVGFLWHEVRELQAGRDGQVVELKKHLLESAAELESRRAELDRQWPATERASKRPRPAEQQPVPLPTEDPQQIQRANRLRELLPTASPLLRRLGR